MVGLSKSGLFCGLQFVLDIGSLPYKKKKKLREDITFNGGYVSYILTKKSSFVIANCEKGLKIDTYKTRKAVQLEIPVVSRSYVEDSLASGRLLDTDEYKVAGKSNKDIFSEGTILTPKWQSVSEEPSQVQPLSKDDLEKFESQKFTSGDQACPKFLTDFQVGKFVVLMEHNAKNSSQKICVLELHLPLNEEKQYLEPDRNRRNMFRIMEQRGEITKDMTLKDKTSLEYFFDSCKDAMEVMQYLVDRHVKSNQKMEPISYLPCSSSIAIGSSKLSQVFDSMGKCMGNMNPQVCMVVSVIAASVCKICNFEHASKMNVDEIAKAKVTLIKIREALENNESTDNLSKEYYKTVTCDSSLQAISNKKTLSLKFDFVQTLQDMKVFSEANSPYDHNSISRDNSTSELPSSYNSFVEPNKISMKEITLLQHGIRCAITWIPPEDPEYASVSTLVGMRSGVCQSQPDLKIVNIFRLYRDAEYFDFTHSMDNKKLLFHSSKPENFFGILSRGLLLPQVVVGEHGGDRTDCGLLGSGIYFTDDIGASVKYSMPNEQKGTRFVLVNEVCLGNSAKFTEKQPNLNKAPEGYNSVQGVGKSDNNSSQFDANEFVIYDKKQQRLRYLVEFVLEGDKMKNPEIPIKPLTVFPSNHQRHENVAIVDVDNATDPLEKVDPGLIIEETGKSKPVPLQQVHIRGSIIDLVAEVVIFQSYVNESDIALEAKYVFPLGGSSAVCGFEAFINGKHVVGKVKEKEQAHREYKQAVSKGHGAYLMDEEQPDVFTVSVGNLPPRARVLIKITYVTELPVMINESDLTDYIQFHLPSTVAPSVKDNILVSGPITQTKTDRVAADSGNLNNFSLVISVEMPFDIKRLECPSNKIKYKITRSKATVQLLNRESLGKDGFRLLIGLAEIHVPRMWSEKHPDKDSQASMLAFYPEFDAPLVSSYRAIILIDNSNSITSDALENDIKKLALMILKYLPSKCCLNVIKFGTLFEELFITEQPLSENIVQTKAECFIQSSVGNLGMSDGWRSLAYLRAVRKFSKDKTLTNVFLVSDGHLDEKNKTLQIARDLAGDSDKVCRIFTFSIGSSANQHFMKSIANASDGFHEHFTINLKSKWKQKVQNQLSKASQPVLTDINIKWGKYVDKDEVTEVGVSLLPIQAPEHVSTLYNSSRLVVYGMVPHCMQAELCAKICGKEISTIVSTSALSVTTGQTIHQLAARSMIKDYEDGMHDVDPLKRDELKKERRPYIIDLSIKNSIVSQYTSFVAIEEREEGENLTSGDGPSVADLVSDVDVDQLTGLPWIGEEPEENIVTVEKVCKKILAAEVAYYSSLAQANRLFEQASDMLNELSNYEFKKATYIYLATKQRLNLWDTLFLEVDVQLETFIEEATRENDTEAITAAQQLADSMKLSGDFSITDFSDFTIESDSIPRHATKPLGAVCCGDEEIVGHYLDLCLLDDEVELDSNVIPFKGTYDWGKSEHSSPPSSSSSPSSACSVEAGHHFPEIMHFRAKAKLADTSETESKAVIETSLHMPPPPAGILPAMPFGFGASLSDQHMIRSIPPPPKMSQQLGLLPLRMPPAGILPAMPFGFGANLPDPHILFGSSLQKEDVCSSGVTANQHMASSPAQRSLKFDSTSIADNYLPKSSATNIKGMKFASGQKPSFSVTSFEQKSKDLSEAAMSLRKKKKSAILEASIQPEIDQSGTTLFGSSSSNVFERGLPGSVLVQQQARMIRSIPPPQKISQELGLLPEQPLMVRSPLAPPRDNLMPQVSESVRQQKMAIHEKRSIVSAYKLSRAEFEMNVRDQSQQPSGVPKPGMSAPLTECLETPQIPTKSFRDRDRISTAGITRDGAKLSTEVKRMPGLGMMQRRPVPSSQLTEKKEKPELESTFLSSASATLNTASQYGTDGHVPSVSIQSEQPELVCDPASTKASISPDRSHEGGEEKQLRSKVPKRSSNMSASRGGYGSLSKKSVMRSKQPTLDSTVPAFAEASISPDRTHEGSEEKQLRSKVASSDLHGYWMKDTAVIGPLSKTLRKQSVKRSKQPTSDSTVPASVEEKRMDESERKVNTALFEYLLEDSTLLRLQKIVSTTEQTIKSGKQIPSLSKFQKLPLFQVLSEAGVMSLGPQMAVIAYVTLLMAFLAHFAKDLIKTKFLPEKHAAVLKRLEKIEAIQLVLEKKNPGLARRLELGSTWEEAIIKLKQKEKIGASMILSQLGI